MINKLSSIASKLGWLLIWVKIVCIGFLGLFFFSIFELAGIKSEAYIIPSVLGFLWSALFLVLIVIFPDIPVKLSAQEKFLSRLKVNLKRGAYHILALLFLVLTSVVILLSFKFIRVWLATS